MATESEFFATAARGTEELVHDELKELGARDVTVSRGGVTFRGELELAYRACLWSRVASRILLPLARFPADHAEALYAGVRRVRWSDHLDARRTLAVDCTTTASPIAHSHFAALKTKDAIVDQIRDRTGQRPSVARVCPDVKIYLHLQGRWGVVGLDLSGEPLHRRGYREAAGSAPLKENLAAAILRLTGWPSSVPEGAPLMDPLCGSGTLPIEAAMMLANFAPGRNREYFGFLGWRQHDAVTWRRLREEARDTEKSPPVGVPLVWGGDADPRLVRMAQENVRRAGLDRWIRLEVGTLQEARPLAGWSAPGLVVTNPPYGERLAPAALETLYAEMGDVLRRHFLGWQAFVFSGNPELFRRIGLRATRRTPLWNGPLECRLLQFPISESPVSRDGGPRWRSSQERAEVTPRSTGGLKSGRGGGEILA